jgi:hypothetical protein
LSHSRARLGFGEEMLRIIIKGTINDISLKFRSYANRLRRKISRLRAVAEYFLDPRSWNNFCYADELFEIKRGISSILSVYEKQTLHKTITERQKQMMAYFNEVENMLHEIKLTVKTENKTFSFWEFLEKVGSMSSDITGN